MVAMFLVKETKQHLETILSVTYELPLTLSNVLITAVLDTLKLNKDWADNKCLCTLYREPAQFEFPY